MLYDSRHRILARIPVSDEASRYDDAEDAVAEVANAVARVLVTNKGPVQVGDIISTRSEFGEPDDTIRSGGLKRRYAYVWGKNGKIVSWYEFGAAGKFTDAGAPDNKMQRSKGRVEFKGQVGTIQNSPTKHSLYE